jgi:hypothetical protein
MLTPRAVFSAGAFACAIPDKGTIVVVATARVATSAQGDPGFIELLREFRFWTREFWDRWPVRDALSRATG